MRVLFLNQAFYPDRVATAQILLDLGLHLQAAGCQVTVLSGKRGYENRQALYPTREIYKGIRIERVGSTALGKKRMLYRILDFLTFDLCLIARLLRVPKQDVVVSFTSPPMVGVLGALFCRLRGGLCVQWLMDVNPDAAIAVGYLRRGSLIARLLTAVFRFSLRQSDLVVVLDRWMKARIAQHGLDEKKILVVPPWSVLEAGDAAVSEQETHTFQFRKQYGLEGKFLILYSGNHSVVHPLDTLLEAAKCLDKKNSDIRFVFVGGGVRVNDVAAAVKSFGLSNVLQLPIQPRENLRSMLEAVDAHVVVMGDRVSGLVHTSKIYGVLSTGKPYIFIGPHESHVSDVLQECPFGFHVRNGDVEAFTAAVSKIRSLSPAELEDFKEANIGYVRKNYEPKKLIEAFFSGIKPRD